MAQFCSLSRDCESYFRWVGYEYLELKLSLNMKHKRVMPVWSRHARLLRSRSIQRMPSIMQDAQAPASASQQKLSFPCPCSCEICMFLGRGDLYKLCNKGTVCWLSKAALLCCWRLFSRNEDDELHRGALPTSSVYRSLSQDARCVTMKDVEISKVLSFAEST